LPFYLSLDVEVRGIHFDYGQPSAHGERRSVLALASHYDVPVETQSVALTLASTGGEYHCRNALFVLTAASVAKRVQLGIAIGIHAGSPYYDSTPAFIWDVQRLLDGYHGGTVRVEAPFLEFTKQDVFEYCLENGVPVNLTFSCERRSDLPCRRCASCKDQMALNESNRGLQAT
jgi:7-cyano-7-deazaguanine synthase